METLLQMDNVNCEFSIFSSLKGISFSVQRGEDVIIFGTENSGVDGLCAVIAGLHPYNGKIVFKGNELQSLTPDAINRMRSEMVYLQRDYGLISNMTVEENITLPLSYHVSLSAIDVEGTVNRLIEEMHLDFCRDMRPVHLKPSELLKTAFARSLAINPDLLLVEHPLEGQCLINTITFLKGLKSWCDSDFHSTIIVTYEPLRFLDFARRFIMIDYGKIVFDGTREEMSHPGNDFVRQFLDISGDGPMQIL